MRIAVYMIGSLGDTLAGLPALWVLRRQFAEAELVLVTDRQADPSRVGPREILEGIDLLDAIEEYPTDEGGGWPAKVRGSWALYRLLRRLKPDLLVYLLRGTRDQPRIRRDLAFFRLAGVRRVAGVEGMPARTPPRRGGNRARMASQADQFLGRLAAAGLPVPPPGQGRRDLGLTAGDRALYLEWEQRQPADGGRRRVAFAPGSKMASKRWPRERFAEVGARLIATHDVWPVVFGGAEDRAEGERLLAGWGRGSLAAGELAVRPAAAALERCAVYVGNDTGTMHLAASAGVRCVALFSSRDVPGLWEPYGAGHVVLRSDPDCAGCFSLTCPRGDNRCLTLISAGAAVRAAEAVLEEGR